ncbi:MAG: DUF2092 domain-containing protein, partial [Synechococcaceae cyanobacterium]|nr:DUF2092 domain-containing protein [Synechococcaceae cyanobacterium]
MALRMSPSLRNCALLLGVPLLVLSPGIPSTVARAQTGAPAAAVKGNPEADRLLRRMSDYLASLKEFAFEADVIEEQFFEPGQRLQFGRTVRVQVRRPDRLRAESTGDQGSTEIVYDGRTATLLDRGQNTYITVREEGSLDRLLGRATREYSLRAPLSHLLYADPYRALPPRERMGNVIGVARIGSHACQHLAFRQKDVDWQIWIRTGDQPLPCKLVITDRNPETRGLQFSAVFPVWVTTPRLSEA